MAMQPGEGIETRTIENAELYPLLQRIRGFEALSAGDAACIGSAEELRVPEGTDFYNRDEHGISFWLLISGEIQIFKQEQDGTRTLVAHFQEGESFGEVALLGGAPTVRATAHALEASRLVRIEGDAFWRLMNTCAGVRQTILQNMAHRLGSYNALQLQREKLVSLGMLAAGLMHELNNPGSAARRAAGQLRETLQTLPEISLRLGQMQLDEEQMQCIRHLQHDVMLHLRPKPASTLEEADAEEELSDWLTELGVKEAWKLAPMLVEAGWRRKDIECTKESFKAETLAETIQWLQGFASSMQSLATIEESLTRVTDLVLAVKRYAYEDKSTMHEVDVHEGLQSTLTILGHKFRHKGVGVEKLFGADVPRIKTCGRGLNQVWTNLLDNAVDAAPEGTKVTVRTWSEAGAVWVSIHDAGSGIPESARRHIFEPFYTTKPVGVGTGLGLDIAYRIVTGQYGGKISFESRPGSTEFLIRLPLDGESCQAG
jgi:signal transduction histidine kinase